ncbi:MFS transporter, partial [Planomonospora algeriensis]
MAEHVANPARRRSVSSRQRRDLIRIWAGLASSMTGARTLGVAYPLLALWLTGSPAQAGWTGFALTVPTLLFYIPAGVMADRLNPRSLILITETARGAAVAGVALAVLLDLATLPHLLAAAFIEGSLWVLHSLGETALIRSFVPRGDLRGMLATSETSSHVAVLAARPLGGFLFGLGPAMPFLVNTALFLLSSLSVLGLGRHRASPAQAGPAGRTVRRAARRPFLRETSDGVRELAKYPFLRNAMALTTVTNLMVNTLIMVFMAGSVALPPLQVGLVLAAGGLGGVLGSALASVAGRSRPAVLTSSGNAMLFLQMWIWVVALCIAAFGGGPLFFGAATLLTGCAGALTNIAVRTFEIGAVDGFKLARVVSVHRLTVHGAVCLAAPLGGLLASVLGTEAAARALFGAMLAVALAVTTA